MSFDQQTDFISFPYLVFDITDPMNAKLLDGFATYEAAVNYCETCQLERPDRQSMLAKVSNTFRTEITYAVERNWV